jgi:hypothetical protein
MEITRAGHLCGNVIGDTYYTHREQNHFMIMFQGFGISEEILMKLKHCGVVWVIIDYAEFGEK